MTQQNEHTGFVPMSPLQFVGIKSYTNCIVHKELCRDPVKLHKYDKKFKCSNFIGARVQVNYDINFELLEYLAQDYWEKCRIKQCLSPPVSRARVNVFK